MKKLILVAAPPAAGKTFVSDKIAAGLGHVAYFDKDTLAPLIECAFRVAGEPFDMDSPFHNDHLRAAEYETVFFLALEALRYEDLALVNAPFGEEIRHSEILKKRKEELNAQGIRLILIWVLSDKETCRRRMAERNLPRDREKLTHWEAYSSGISYAPPFRLTEEGAVNELLTVDTATEETVNKSVKNVIFKLKEN